MFFHPKNMKSENNNPWFKPWFNILLHTQSIVCATVNSQCLEYLGYISLTLMQRCREFQEIFDRSRDFPISGKFPVPGISWFPFPGNEIIPVKIRIVTYRYCWPYPHVRQRQLVKLWWHVVLKNLQQLVDNLKLKIFS